MGCGVYRTGGRRSTSSTVQPRAASRVVVCVRTSFLAAAAIAAALTIAAPAGAITYGVPDGNGHPQVGALLAQQAYSDGTWTTCSGTLISPTVFLTAAHCDEGVSRVNVTFDS